MVWGFNRGKELKWLAALFLWPLSIYLCIRLRIFIIKINENSHYILDIFSYFFICDVFYLLIYKYRTILTYDELHFTLVNSLHNTLLGLFLFGRSFVSVFLKNNNLHIFIFCGSLRFSIREILSEQNVFGKIHFFLFGGKHLRKIDTSYCVNNIK